MGVFPTFDSHGRLYVKLLYGVG